jgi:hypothetical protein
MLAGITAGLRQAGISAGDATLQAYGRINAMIQAQAVTLAYIDVVSVMAVVVMCLVPLVTLMRRGKPGEGAAEPMH